MAGLALRLAFFVYSGGPSANDGLVMSAMLQLLTGHKVQNFAPGDVVLEQGGAGGRLLVLIQGEVEILRDNVRVAKASASPNWFQKEESGRTSSRHQVFELEC